jgi:hypothetical protein
MSFPARRAISLPFLRPGILTEIARKIFIARILRPRVHIRRLDGCREWLIVEIRLCKFTFEPKSASCNSNDRKLRRRADSQMFPALLKLVKLHLHRRLESQYKRISDCFFSGKAGSVPTSGLRDNHLHMCD